VINVHVCPHTHDDVGWDETYMQYYQGDGPIGGRNVTRILRAVVAGLLQDPKRRFSYVEQAYFQVWFETQEEDVKASVRALVASKQLVFLNGGWSMHDEASPSFVDMLDNTAVGQRAILDNFGPSALPKLTWQIDPFGHSAFQGMMSGALAGYAG
jgi:alpha-mannosidase